MLVKHIMLVLTPTQQMTLFFKLWFELSLGGAVGLGGLVYYLMREESAEANSKSEVKETEKLDVNKVTRFDLTDCIQSLFSLNGFQATKSQVLDILQQVIASQEKMKTVMKDLTKELIKTDFA